MEFDKGFLRLPEFSAGRKIRKSSSFRVVMDYKPNLKGQEHGTRFFIEPLTDQAEHMLQMASIMHNIPNFNEREIVVGSEQVKRLCLRADFIVENLKPLMLGVTEQPALGADTVPSPERMERCILKHPHYYSFKD